MVCLLCLTQASADVEKRQEKWNALAEKDADSATNAAAHDVQAARTAMVEELWQLDAVRTERVAEVFAKVDRHRFTPGASLEEVYDATTAVRTKWDERGSAISSISAPQIQAFMLEQADIRPGMRVLEVGSGGVNAAMLAELVGDTGSVTTMDIDSEVSARTRDLLDSAGYTDVRVACADAEQGLPELGLADRVLVTVGCWDVPAALPHHLAAGGRMVIPLRMRGITRSLALERAGEHLVAASAETCGFVKAQGLGEHQERMLLLLGDRVALRFDDDNGPAEPGLLDGVLDTKRCDVWTGVTVQGQEPFDSLPLWLATTLPGFGQLSVDPHYEPAVDGGPEMAVPQGRWFPSAYVDTHGDSLAYLGTRRCDDGLFEFGAHAFGPHADTAAEGMAEQIRAWGRDHRDGLGPVIAVWPQEISDHEPSSSQNIAASSVVTKRHTRITISWPDPRSSRAGQVG